MIRPALTILVTGATGTVGREVAQRIPAQHRVKLLTRRPDAVAFTADHIEVAAGEYAGPVSLSRALHGVDRALLVTADVGGDHDTRFLRAARSAGVRHIVKLSGASVSDPGADDLITRWQRNCEQQLCASGMGWTLLRPRSFMSNTLAWAPTISSEGRVRALYGDSVNACVDPRDIADVAVRALTEEGHEGKAHVLTGPAPISAVQQTKLLAELLGRRITFEELTKDEVRSQYRRRHSGPLADALLRSAERQRAGAKSRVENTVLRVTGRAPRSYAQWAADHLSAFGRAA